jgi:hypothetical protein
MAPTAKSLLIRTLKHLAATEGCPYLLTEPVRRACAGRLGYYNMPGGSPKVNEDIYMKVGFAIAGEWHKPGRPGWIPACQAEACRIAEIAARLDDGPNA